LGTARAEQQGQTKQQREQIPFAAGILWENDIDYAAAMALAARVVSVKAFNPITAAETDQAKELIDRCDQVICTLDPSEIGQLGTGLKELIEYAKTEGKISE